MSAIRLRLECLSVLVWRWAVRRGGEIADQPLGTGATRIAVGIATATPMANEVSQAEARFGGTRRVERNTKITRQRGGALYGLRLIGAQTLEQ